MGGSNCFFFGRVSHLGSKDLDEVRGLLDEDRILTIGDLELWGRAADLLNVALLVELVGLLVVDEEVGGALTSHPTLENLLVLGLVERVLFPTIQIKMLSVTRFESDGRHGAAN